MESVSNARSLKAVAARMQNRVLSVREQVMLAHVVVRAFFKASRLSRADIEDCFSDVLEDLARRPLGAVDERGSAPVLIQRVKWSLLDSLRRKARRERRREQVEAHVEILTQLASAPFAAAAFEREDDLDRVLAGIESLEPVDIDLVVSTTAYDETLREVAERSGISVSHAWQRREAALNVLRSRCNLAAAPAVGRTSGARRGSGRAARGRRP